MIDPSLSIDRDSHDQWTATLYLNDRLTFDTWESQDLEGCLTEIKDKMRSIQSALNNAL